MLSLDIGKCSGVPETCIAVEQANTAADFYDAVADLEPGASDTKEMLGDFVISCAKGTCPGRNPELTRELLRKRLHPDSE